MINWVILHIHVGKKKVAYEFRCAKCTTLLQVTLLWTFAQMAHTPKLLIYKANWLIYQLAHRWHWEPSLVALVKIQLLGLVRTLNGFKSQHCSASIGGKQTPTLKRRVNDERRFRQKGRRRWNSTNNYQGWSYGRYLDLADQAPILQKFVTFSNDFNASIFW